MPIQNIGIVFIMSATLIIIIVSVTVAFIGLIFEITSRSRNRHMLPNNGKKPAFVHRNLRLMGGFRYVNGIVFYHSYCLGPFPLVPIGCYVGGSAKSSDVTGSLKANAVEIIALYFRWGWLIAAIALLTLLV